jgi:hypothetical protein
MLLETSTPVSRRRRNRLAKGLRNAVRAAEDRPRAFSSAIPVQRDAIAHEKGFILQIALDLESDDEVGRRGVELLGDLLTHGDSPIYTEYPDGELRRALVQAHAALFLS